MPTPDPSNVDLIGASVIGDILPRLNQKQLRILQCESKLIKLREAQIREARKKELLHWALQDYGFDPDSDE
jgi:hypothetical protein